MKKTLFDLKTNEKGKVISLEGGHKFRNRLETRGIRKGKEIRVVAKQPHGPIVVDNGSCKLTLGRGMAKKIQIRSKE